MGAGFVHNILLMWSHSGGGVASHHFFLRFSLKVAQELLSLTSQAGWWYHLRDLEAIPEGYWQVRRE